MKKIVVVENNFLCRSLLATVATMRVFRKKDVLISTVKSIDDFRKLDENLKKDALVILDVHLPGGISARLIPEIKRLNTSVALFTTMPDKMFDVFSSRVKQSSAFKFQVFNKSRVKDVLKIIALIDEDIAKNAKNISVKMNERMFVLPYPTSVPIIPLNLSGLLIHLSERAENLSRLEALNIIGLDDGDARPLVQTLERIMPILKKQMKIVLDQDPTPSQVNLYNPYTVYTVDLLTAVEATAKQMKHGQRVVGDEELSGELMATKYLEAAKQV